MYLVRLGSFLLLVLGLVMVLLPRLLECQCNTCSVVYSLACVSQTEFQVCINGSPTGALTSCPNGYVCSTVATTGICQLGQNGVAADCGECNLCDITNTFACTGPQSYALCLGNTTPSSLTGTCAPDYVCSINYQQICGQVALGIVPTCPLDGGLTTTIAPTTVSPVDYPQKYCRNLQQYGRFPVGYNISSTCRQYVFCVVNGGIWSGQLYDCPGRTYFNSSSRLCEDAIPLNCS